MKDVRIPRQAQWQGHCQDWLGDVSTATQHKEKQECCNRGGEQRRKGAMVRGGKQKGEWVKQGSVLLRSPLVRPVVEVRGNAALPRVAGIRLLQSSRHCASLSPGCHLCSDAENLQREGILHLFPSAASRQPSLTPPADPPVNPQYRRPRGPSHATPCPLAASSPQRCSRAWEMLLRGTTYFPPFLSLLMEHRGGKQAFCSSRCAWAASFSQVCPCTGQAGRNPGPSDPQAAGCQWQCLQKERKDVFVKTHIFRR